MTYYRFSSAGKNSAVYARPMSHEPVSQERDLQRGEIGVKMIKLSFVAFVSVVVLATTAYAGSPSFTGIYLGGHFALGLGRVKTEYARTGTHNLRLMGSVFGPLGGLHVGYQKDFSAIVLGIEAGLNAAAQNGNNKDLQRGLVIKFKRKMPDYFASVHVGVKMGRAMLYTKLGGMFSKFQAQVEDGALRNKKTTRFFGPFLGFGIATMVNKSLMLGAEGTYTFYPKKNVIRSLSPTIPVVTKVQPSILDFKIRLSFKL